MIYEDPNFRKLGSTYTYLHSINEISNLPAKKKKRKLLNIIYIDKMKDAQITIFSKGASNDKHSL